MITKQLVVATAFVASLLGAVSCAQRAATKAPPGSPAATAAKPSEARLAVGDVPGAVPVLPPGTVRVTPANPVPPPSATTIAPMPAPGEDSAATAQRRLMNLPKFGDYVYVTQLPEAIERTVPEFPLTARQAGVSGTVMVQVLVLADGTVGDTHVIKSIPPLDDAAVSCVRKWKFKPAQNDKGATPVWVAIPVTFTLH